MLLENKNLVIYGAGGSVGSVVAKVFASEGSNVFLTGRRADVIRQTAAQIKLDGGNADHAIVDALDSAAIENYLDDLAANGHPIDISFNLIGMSDVQGLKLANMGEDEFLTPVTIAMKSHFLTARAAAKHMISRRQGVILSLSANAAKSPCQNVGGFGIACAAIEALSRQLAAELGKYNIRVVCLRSAGSPDAKGVREVFVEHAALAGVTLEEFESQFAENTMLKRLPLLIEIANAAVLVASDKASAITSAIINITCGELSD